MKKIYLIGGILVIINLILIIFVIFPLINGIKKKSEDLVFQKTELILLEQKKENLVNLKKIYTARQTGLEKIEAVFVDPETPIDFISFLEETAKTSQASIKISLASETKEETDFGPALSFNISLEGPFPNFLKFLEKLENSLYLIEILDLNIRRLNGETPGRISVTFPIRVITK